MVLHQFDIVLHPFNIADMQTSCCPAAAAPAEVRFWT